MALCSKCGKDNRDGSRFCQTCGTPLTAAAPVQPKPQASAPAVSKRSSQELAMGPTCSSCGTLNAPGMKFCKMCGSPLEAPSAGQPIKISCPSCGGQTPGAYKFCQHCGTPLPKGAPAPAPIAPRPASATPAPVAASPIAPMPVAPRIAAPGAPSPAPRAVSPAPVYGAPPATFNQAPAPGYPDSARTIVPGPTPVPAPAPTPNVAPIAATPVAVAVAPAAVPETIIDPAGGAKTIIDMDVPALRHEEAAPVPAPPAIPNAVSGSIQTPDPHASAGKATLGPGARSVPSTLPSADRQPLARLVSVNRDGSDGETHLVTEESVDLGRVEGQLLFCDDPYLSDRHCRFFIQNGLWMVQDLQSCNGVYVRLKAITELKHGDRMLLGKQVFSFESLSEQERTLSPAVEHGVSVFGSPLRTPWGRLRQLTVAGICRDVYYLYRPKLTIGREEGDIIFPDDEFMSRRHLALSMVGVKTLLEDLGSSNGTYVRIRDLYAVSTGDMLRVGDQLLRFEQV
jgi:pSer/pThr/pTyr-binding forkhead associated (FHA) protein